VKKASSAADARLASVLMVDAARTVSVVVTDAAENGLQSAVLGEVDHDLQSIVWMSM
jgi:hypothetical protein